MSLPDHDAPEPTDEEIALGAYRLWLQEGCPSGRDKEHWLKSRDLLRARRGEELQTPEQSISTPCTVGL